MSNVIEFNRNEEKNYFSELKMLRAKDLREIFVNTSPATFTKWNQEGILTAHKIGGGVYYKLSDIEKLIETSAVDKEII